MSPLVRLRSCAIALASSAAIALVLATSFAAADGVDADRDGVPDSLEDLTQRTVVIPPSRWDDSFSVSSHLGGGAVQDQFEFWYWAGHFGVWYGVKDGASITYSVELLNLFEWKDKNGDGRIDGSEILHTTPLSTAAFGGVAVNRTDRRESDGGQVYSFLMNSRDRQVSLNVTMAQRFTLLNGVTLTPMEARMNVTLKPILTDPTASVALELGFETGQGNLVAFENRSWDEQKRFAPGEHEINVTGTEGGRTASAFFSWANDAIASGRSVAVGSGSQMLDAAHYNLTIAYPGGSPQAGLRVAHQMAFGIESVAFATLESATPSTPPLQPDLFLFTGTFAGVAALVASTVIVSNRRRARHEEENRKP